VTVARPDARDADLHRQARRHFKGSRFSARVFVTQIMQKLDGKWREKFYQVTALSRDSASSAMRE